MSEQVDLKTCVNMPSQNQKETSASPRVFTKSKVQPLVRIASCSDSQIVGVLKPDPTDAPYLVEHQLNGKPIFPFVLALETFAETISSSTKRYSCIDFRSVKVVNGLVFNQSRPYELRCLASLDSDGFWNLRLIGDRFDEKGDKISSDFPYYLGQARGVPSREEPEFKKRANAFVFTNVDESVPKYCGPCLDGLYHGQKLRALKRCLFMKESKEGIGEIIAPSREELLGNESENVTIDGSALDAALFFCSSLNVHTRIGRRAVPEFIAGLRYWTGLIRPNSKCAVYAILKERKTLPFGYIQVVFDFDVYNEEGTSVCCANGFRMTEF
ncbi:MAG: polyketide synthase dehydratase domain-containing protein [Thermoguttaceae bacterium]|nr:polyketide synthase dehydratase domain-containing protein [Thermoguttaceae bacterium]